MVIVVAILAQVAILRKTNLVPSPKSKGLVDALQWVACNSGEECLTVDAHRIQELQPATVQFVEAAAQSYVLSLETARLSNTFVEETDTLWVTLDLQPTDLLLARILLVDSKGSY